MKFASLIALVAVTSAIRLDQEDLSPREAMMLELAKEPLTDDELAELRAKWGTFWPGRAAKKGYNWVRSHRFW